MRQLVALIFVAIAFAGCSESNSVTPTATTALDVWGVGLAAGAAWQPDAQLRGVGAMELDAAGIAAWKGSSERAESVRAVTDEIVGDGTAKIWRFRFASNTTESVQDIFVTAGGIVDSIRNQNQTEIFNAEGNAITATPAVNSPALAKTAKEAINWDGNGSVYVFYFATPCHAYAGVYFYSDVTKDADTAVFLDAMSGEITGIGATAVCMGPAPDVGVISFSQFSVTAASGLAIPLELKSAHDAMTFVLELDGAPDNLPLQTVAASITGPEGMNVQISAQTGATVVQSSGTAQNTPAGDATVSLTMDPGLTASGRLYFCSSGVVASGNPACS